MKYFTVEVNGQETNLRLTSQDCIKIEDVHKVKLLDYIQDYSITTIVNLFRYMLQGGRGSVVSQKEAEKFYDDLVDEGWALEKMVKELIMPVCQVSGLLTESDLQNIMRQTEEVKATQSNQ